jgi:hypothetical protein
MHITPTLESIAKGSKASGMGGKQPTPEPTSPGAIREDSDVEDEEEDVQMTAVDASKGGAAVGEVSKGGRKAKSGDAPESKKKKKKRKSKHNSETEGEEEEETVETMMRKRTKKAELVKEKKKEKKENKAKKGEEEEEEQEEQEEQEEPEEENNDQKDKDKDRMARERRSARRTGYRNLSMEVGFNKGRGAEAYQTTDVHKSAFSLTDVQNLASAFPSDACMEEEVTYELGEFERRALLIGERIPKKSQRAVIAHLEPLARQIIVFAVDQAIRSGVKTVQPIMMEQAVELYMGGMDFSCAQAPLGLLRHGKKTPVFRRKQVDSEGNVTYEESEETIVHPFDPNQKKRSRNSKELEEFKSKDNKAVAGEARLSEKCLQAYKQRCDVLEEQKTSKKQKPKIADSQGSSKTQ